MKIYRLYIDNFMCHENSFIDFTNFNSALIVGKVENNDLYSNAVGKTSLFKAIEYVLFNQADVNLDKIIRDDTSLCQVALDFVVNEQEYRILRKRSKKGSTDVSLFQRTSNEGEVNEVYHTFTEDTKGGIYTIINNDKFWKDISGRRAADTEREIEKLIKLNSKAFRSTIHFIQNDLMGLPTATPENRKKILKEALNLIVYSKLEKIAKEKSSLLSKELDRLKILVEALGDPNSELIELNTKLTNINSSIEENNNSLSNLDRLVNNITSKIALLTNKFSILQEKSLALVNKENSLLADKNRLEISIKEYSSKKTNIIKTAKELVNEVKDLQDSQSELIEIDYNQVDLLLEKINSAKDIIAHNNIIIHNNMIAYEELKIPFPDDSVCKHCRQPLTLEHKQICKAKINDDMVACQTAIANAKQEIAKINTDILLWQQSINSMQSSKRQLENINSLISVKNKEIEHKKNIHAEYVTLFNKFNSELEGKLVELNNVREELKASSIDEAEQFKNEIGLENAVLSDINSKIISLNKELAHLNATKAVIEHNIAQKTIDLNKLNEFKSQLLDLESKFSIYPSILQAFSSTGIPNIIIQNVLDDLQIEANELLFQLKPGLQLSFFVEKTVEKTGDQADTLDIKYFINNKERYYEQLSGAQKLAVAFSLKLGLSFLLHKMFGTNIKFLLLDEVDQALDKASVDAFADIVKFFQKDFTILVITHNDRLKDKFSHAIVVEQDINMVSRARVMSEW